MTTITDDAATSSSETISNIYFGYGSNMWLDQMKRRCPGSRLIGVGYLKNWKWFICQRGYANIRLSEGDTVYGLLYTVTETDERSLDGFEGVPKSYIRKKLPIVYLGQENFGSESEEYRIINSLVYVDVKRTSEGPIKLEYITRMNSAIRDAVEVGMPENYVKDVLRGSIPDSIPN